MKIYHVEISGSKGAHNVVTSHKELKKIARRRVRGLLSVTVDDREVFLGTGRDLRDMIEMADADGYLLGD